jgi:phosphoribosyl 1,2-cyclic phosphodiesterase
MEWNGTFFVMRVTFWGVRGSIATPITGKTIQEKIEKVLSLATAADIQSPESISNFLKTLNFSSKSTYGGNTTCLEVRDKKNRLYIIDAGTGLRDLGNKILPEGYLTGKGHAYWLFTHSHWDHIQGLPFFVPAYIPGNIFDIYTSVDNLKERLTYQHIETHFPIPFEGLRSTRNYHPIQQNSWTSINESMRVTSKAMRHPGGSFSYKFEEDGKTFIFASDAEFNLDEMESIETYIDYFRGADILVFDTQYTFEESLNKIDWGHSSASIATDISLKAGVKKLVMFHHDPSYTDEKLDAVYLRALNYKNMMTERNELEIIMAYEGLELEI